MARPSFTTAINSGWSFDYVSGGSGNISSGTGLSRYASETVSGTPKRQKPKGWIPPQAYSLSRRYMKLSNGDLYETITVGGNVFRVARQSGNLEAGPHGTAFTSYADQVLPSQPVPSSLRDRALIGARMKMKRQDVNLGVAFAERNQTAKLVGDTAIQLVKSLRQLRRGNFRGAANALGLANPGRPRGSSVPSRWLELQYGWKPLLSDVYGATDALARRSESDWIVTAKDMAYLRDYNEVLYPGNRSVCGYLSGSSLRGVAVRIDAIPQNDLLMSFAAMGITNPLEIGWELVPFSFVVDWFLPIGDFLNSLDAMLGYGPAWTSISTLSRYHWKHHPMSGSFTDSSSGATTSTNRSGVSDAEIKTVGLTREALSGVPLPTMPRFKDPRSLGHMANALSLLSQVFGRR